MGPTDDLISKKIGSITSGIATGLVNLGFDPKKLYAPDILNNYTLNSEKVTVEDLIKDSEEIVIKNQKANIFRHIKGGFEQAKKDYDDLGAKTFRQIPEKEGRVGRLSDGRVVNVRNGSFTIENEPTLEIKNPDGSSIRFKY
jgi:hypothetical protein